ncbi:TrmJ/YjtD family RNA methyltransferase [bacterium]|nr:TrmJ/YjtD family RNA methyltransferase [bacterium]
MRRYRNKKLSKRPVLPASHEAGPPTPESWWRFAEDDRLKQVAIILVEPSRAENVGAAARAMKTMGIHRLIVVGSDVWRTGKARAMGVGAHDILESVEEYGTLAEAVSTMKAVAVTTARRRKRSKPVFPMEAIAPNILGVGEHGPVGVVFGREEYGLTLSELLLGDWWVTIPINTSYPSLNLAQSVMVVCHELARAARGPMPAYPWNPATNDRRRQVIDHAASTMMKTGLQPRPDLEGYLLAISRMFDRALLEERDVELMHGLFHQMDVFVHKMNKLYGEE